MHSDFYFSSPSKLNEPSTSVSQFENFIQSHCLFHAFIGHSFWSDPVGIATELRRNFCELNLFVYEKSLKHVRHIRNYSTVAFCRWTSRLTKPTGSRNITIFYFSVHRTIVPSQQLWLRVEAESPSCILHSAARSTWPAGAGAYDL